ncbi:hypothetical protein L7F22_057604 [Adiantum nelumboides]|nr:hypothetical protein [Adiantum nelumboides]
MRRQAMGSSHHGEAYYVQKYEKQRKGRSWNRESKKEGNRDASKGRSKSPGRRNVQCHYCDKFGHIKKDCNAWKRDKGKGKGKDNNAKEEKPKSSVKIEELNIVQDNCDAQDINMLTENNDVFYDAQETLSLQSSMPAELLVSGKQEAFDKLKKKLTSQPVLVLPDLSKPFEVQCDACGDCLGAVLLQEGHAIAYESRRLSSDEQILGIYEKELLAVLHALDSWKHYLLGTPFILRMDHQSLKYFMTQTKLSGKQMRWANFLSRFSFHIAHIAGKHNQVADALSRRPKVNAVSIATHNDLSSMIDEYAIDPDFKDVISAIALGKKEEPFTLEDGYLLHGNRLCITHSLREKVMYESHAPTYAGHRGIQS